MHALERRLKKAEPIFRRQVLRRLEEFHRDTFIDHDLGHIEQHGAHAGGDDAVFVAERIARDYREIRQQAVVRQVQEATEGEVAEEEVSIDRKSTSHLEGKHTVLKSTRGLG